MWREPQLGLGIALHGRAQWQAAQCFLQVSTHILVLVGLYVNAQASLHLSLQLLCLHSWSCSLFSSKQTMGESSVRIECYLQILRSIVATVKCKIGSHTLFF